MSELRSLFAEQVSGVEAELVGPRLDDAGRARVARGARRGRRIQTIRTSAMATLVVAALGAGGWGLRDLLDRPDIANPPVPTGFTTPSVTPTPSTTPSASHDWSTVAAGDLPPAFADADPHQPASRQMQDWVWDYVDDSWTVASYLSGTMPPTAAGTGGGVIYLIAPDNTLFHLLADPQDLTAASETKDFFDEWHVGGVDSLTTAARSAMVTLCPTHYGDWCLTARLDLVSGDLSRSFLGAAEKAILGSGYYADTGGPWATVFMERKASGADAWFLSDFNANVMGVFWNEADGSFRASSISAVVNAKPAVTDKLAWRGLLAPSRDKALFVYDSDPWIKQHGPESDVVPSPAELYLFDFAADTTRRIDPLLPAAEQCSVTGVIDDTSGVVACGPTSSFMGGGDTSKQRMYRFFFSGMTAPVPYSAQVVEVAWYNRSTKTLPEPKNPNPDALGWVQ